MILSASRAGRRLFVVIAVAAPMLASAAGMLPDVGRAEAKRAAPAMPSPLDSQVQSIKRDALQIQRQTDDLKRQLQTPRYSRTDIYLGVRAPGLLIDRVVVRIDGGAPLQVDYDRSDAIALLHGGLATLAHVNIPRGQHQLRAEVTGHYADDKPHTPPVVKTLSADFEKSDAAAELEVNVVTEGFFSSRPSLRLVQWLRAS